MRLALTFTLLAALCLSPGLGHAFWTLSVTDEVLVPDARRLGVNLGNDSWHTGSVLTKERVRNGGFEGVLYRQITHGAAQGRMHYMDSYPVGEWETLIPEMRGAFLTGPARGALSQLETELADTPDAKGIRPRYRFPGMTTPPRDYDGLLLESVRPETGWLGQHGGDWWVFTSANATVSTLSGDLPPGSPGKTAVHLDAPDLGIAEIMAPLFGVQWADPNGVWKLSFWCKGEGSMDAYLGDIASRRKGAQAVQAIPLEPEWRFFELFIPIADYPHEMLGLGFALTDGAAVLDEVSCRMLGDTNPTAFRDPIVQALSRLQPGSLRYHQIGGSSLDNWLAPRMTRMAYSSSRQDRPPDGQWPGHPADGGRARVHPYGLHQFLELSAHIQADPWLCVPGTFTEAEMLGLMEYLAAPVTMPYGLLRADNGQVRPWTEVFSSIHIEIGNEAWNMIPPFALGGYSVRGEYWNRLFQTAKTSPWHSPNVVLHAGGQAVNVWRNANIVKETPMADSLAIAPYLGHDLDATVAALPPERLLGWVRGMAWHILTKGWMEENSRKVHAPLSAYEVNYHLTGGNAPAGPRKMVVAGMGGTTILADWLLGLMSRHGVRVQNLFTLLHEYQTVGHERIPLWGIALVLKQGEERYRPLFLAAEMINKALPGDMVRVAFSPRQPSEVTDYKADSGTPPTSAPYLSVYAVKNDGKLGVVLINMHPTRSCPVALRLPGGFLPAKARFRELSGPSLAANNEFGHPPQVTIKERDASTILRGEAATLPPASISVVIFE